MTSEKEAVSEDARPLDPAAVKRLATLLNEITNMHIAVVRLLKVRDSDDYSPAPLIELHDAMDCRLARAIDLVAGGDWED